MLLTTDQFLEYAKTECFAYGFDKVKFNFNKPGVTISAEINFETVFNQCLPHRLRAKFFQDGAYICDGTHQKTPNKDNVDFWLDEYEPSLNNWIKTVRIQIENNYMTVCNKIYLQLKISDLWTTL